MSNARILADLMGTSTTVPSSKLSLAAGDLPSGSVLQVQRTQFTGTNSVSVSAATDTVISDLTVNITPTSTSSKIMISAGVFHEQTYDAWDSVFFFYRDTTKLAAPQVGSTRASGIAVANNPYYAAENSSTPNWVRYDYFDEPSSSSQLTYKVGFRGLSAQTFYLNRTLSDSDVNGYERGISYISATEIAG